MSHKWQRRWRSVKKQQMLALLQAGLALGLTRSANKYFHIIGSIPRELRKIARADLYRLLHEFRQEKLVEYRELKNGTIGVVLTERGQKRALQFNVDKLAIKQPPAWDKKWRVVIFDIPEKRRRARDALREKLKELGFYEWQKSVFIYPYPCRDEIEFLIEFFEILPHVRYGEMANVINEAELKLHFGL